MHGCLETETEELLVFGETSTRFCVASLFGTAQSCPPLFAGGVHRLGSRLFQDVPSPSRRGFVVGERDYHAAAFPQRVFIEEDFVFGKAFVAGFLDPAACYRADSGSGGAQDGRTKQSQSSDGADTGDKRHQDRTSSDPDAAAKQRTHGRTHARLLGSIGA